jgi:hypothetical protein
MNRTSWLSRSYKIILVAAVVLTSIEPFVTPAHAQGLEMWNTNCKKAYKKWKTLATHKAFAVSNSSSGGGNGQACGYSWAASTKSAAEQSAIKSCEAETHYRSGKCWVSKSE